MRDRYDVVVVGAGPLGLASALHLAESDRDRSILVVEARAGPGEGSMGASNSMVRDVFSSRDNQLLARSSIAFYRGWMEKDERLRTPVPLLDLYGYLWLLPESLREEYSGYLRRGGAALDAHLVPLEELNDCPGLEVAPKRWYEGDEATPPEAIAVGLFGRTCGALAPELLAQAYRERCEALGVDFLFNAVVRRLSFEGREEILLHEPSRAPFAFQEHIAGRLRISAVHLGDGRTVRTDRVVVAGGAWSEKILRPLGVATACSPRVQTTHSIVGPAVDELLAWEPRVDPVDRPGGRARCPFLILPSGATLKPVLRQRQLWLGSADTVAHPIGTEEDPARDGRLDFDMARLGSREGYATDMLPAVSPYLPRFETTAARLENTWGGYYNYSPDGIPVLTEEPYGVLFVGGDSGSGIMKADALGRLVAARCAGEREARLFTGERYPVDRISLLHRSVEEERIIL